MTASAIDPQLAFLDVAQQIPVISDGALVAAVGSAPLPKSVKLTPKPLTPVAGLHGRLALAPSDLLSELAEVSSPPHISSKLRDLTLRWAWLRYCWAFASVPGRATMRPSPDVIALVNHHRTLASEQLGIGMALAVARDYLRRLHGAQSITFIDADIALTGGGSGMLGVSQMPGTRMRPDYFALVDAFMTSTPPISATYLYAIECKGSFGYIHNRQLKKAACQVQGVCNAAGTPPPSLLFATAVLKSGFRVRALDPDGEGWSATHEQIENAQRSPGNVEFSTTDGTWVIHDMPGFLRDMEQLREAALLSYAGQYQTANQRVLAIDRSAQAPSVPAGPALDDGVVQELAKSAPTETRREVDSELQGALAGEEQGVRLRMPLRDGRLLEAFTGVDNAHLERARTGDAHGVRALQAESPTPDTDRGVAEARRSGILRKPLDDGRVLEVRITD